MANLLQRAIVNTALVVSGWLNAGISWAGSLEGIDISKWQLPEKVNFPAAQPSHPFVIIKAVGGLVEDPLFATHWMNAVLARMMVAVYLYWYDDIDPIAQANKLHAVVADLAEVLGYLPRVFIDVEKPDMNPGIPNSVRLAKLKQTKDRLESLGYRVAGYSNADTVNTMLSPAPQWLKEFLHWIASYTPAGNPVLPSGFTDAFLVLWQWAIWGVHWWATAVPGCQPSIDKNRFRGTLEQAIAYLGPPAPLPEPPPDVEKCEWKAKLLPGFDSLRIRDTNNTNSNESVVGFIYPADTVTVVHELVLGSDIWWIVLKGTGSNVLAGWAAKRYNGVTYLQEVEA